MKIILFAAALRKNSCNKKLINLAHKIIQDTKQHETQLIDFADLTVPLYDGDIEEHQGLPKNAKKLVTLLNSNDVLIISSPEYNFSIPGTLKNLLDWVSRATPMPLAKLPILLMSASPSLIGGNRGLLQARIPLAACAAYVYPNMFSLANAYEVFTDDGQLKDQELQKHLEKNILGFLEFTKKLQQ